MNISDLLGGDADVPAQQLASQFNLTPEQARSAFQALAPMVAAGLQHEVSSRGEAGLGNALQTGNHQRYLSEPQLLAQPSATTEGNAILGHIFGSKDVSRDVATQAAQKTGLDQSILKKMLPVIAPIVMGAIARRMGAGGRTQPGTPRTGGGGLGGGGLGGVLGGMLDRDGDGSPLDDLIGMIGGGRR